MISKLLLGFCTLFSSPGTESYREKVPLKKFKKILTQFSDQQTKALNEGSWFNEYNPFLDPEREKKFKPFAQKTVLPANSSVAFFGDLHGNIEGLRRILCYLHEKQLITKQGTIIDPKFYMVFLGDYVDRGQDGALVIFTLLTLKNKNPDHVFLVRGNHEDSDINSHYGFLQELISLYGKDTLGRDYSIPPSTFDFVFNIYNFMPAVLYLGIENQEGGIDYIHCCHGGLELGYNPAEFLSSSSTYQAVSCIRTQEFKQLSACLKEEIKNALRKKSSCLGNSCYYIGDSYYPDTPTSPYSLGLMWADFDADNQGTHYISGRDLVYGKDLTEFLLKTQSPENAKICAIFRAHQHHGTMLDNLKITKGIAPLFNNLVYTFLSVPVENTGFNFDSIGILHIGDSYQNSNLEHHVINELQNTLDS